ncbi:MAG: hypothetical protein ACPGSD_15340 [Flavobacteriales bacterium]
MTYSNIKNTLQTIAQLNSETTIEGFIAYDSLNYNENDCLNYIQNIINPKTSMQMAFTFLQYSDIKGFYNTYKKDILKKQKEFDIQNQGLKHFKGDSNDNLCWIILELTATKMADNLGIDY